jgi:SNF2 family DNA or RNA helicase
MTLTYDEFLASKQLTAPSYGVDVPTEGISAKLFPFQQAIVKWALRKGRAALFTDTGTGKTAMQLEWAKHVHQHTKRPVLIVAPLAVAQQTKREGEKFDIAVNVCRSQADVVDGVNICNYEMLQHFVASAFSALVLDESSILKSYDSKTRGLLNAFAALIPYRLACTATPSPNDLI